MIILAISGGVDSVVLLHKVLKNMSPDDVVAAHVDHGAREDSTEDARMVEGLCKKYSVKFELKTLNLGNDFSEEKGRLERYGFFEELRQKYEAKYIATAHHKDDIIETAVINIIRGTGRRGLISLGSTSHIKRPLRNFCKQELVAYAIEHGLEWVEDSSNQDTKYLRNYIRRDLIPRATAENSDFKLEMLNLIEKTRSLNKEIDLITRRVLERRWPADSIEKNFIKSLDSDIIKELVLSKARQDYNEYYISRERLDSAAEFIKTKTTGKRLELNGRLSIFVEKSVIRFNSRV